MNGRAAGWLGAVACAGVAGVVALAVACIPDLPPAQPTADGGDDADEIPGCGDGIVDLDAEQCDPGVPIDPDASFAGCTGMCQMDCPGGFVWAVNNHCYVRTGNKQPFEQVAANDCNKLLPNTNTHLVTFASEQEFEAVAGAIDAGPFWVGLLSNPSQLPNTYTSAQQYEPGWSPSCSGCFAHTEDASVPLGGPQNQGCVEAFSYFDASWRQYPCINSPEAGKLIVVCEREPRGTTARACGAGICFEIPATYGLKRYIYVSTKASVEVAQQRCAAEGGSLVVLESSEEREQIWYELSRLPSLNLLSAPSFWIGLSLTDGGDWVWDDGSEADAHPSPWGDQQPRPQGSATHAYLVQNASNFDTTLAQLAGPTLALPYVCQVPLVTSDAGDGGDAGDAGEAGTGDASDAGASE